MSTYVNPQFALLSKLLSVVLVVLLGCHLCDETELERTISPDGKWVAVTIMRDCGATTSEVVSIDVRPIAESSARQENIVMLVKHEQIPDVEWLSNSVISVNCPHCPSTDIIEKKVKVGSITVQ